MSDQPRRPFPSQHPAPQQGDPRATRGRTLPDTTAPVAGAQQAPSWQPPPNDPRLEDPRPKRPPRWRTSRDPAQAALEATLVGTLDVADDEPTRVGQVLEDQHPQTDRNPKPQARKQEEPSVQISEPPPKVTRNTEEPSPATRAGYVTVVATHVDAPPGTPLPFIQDADSPKAASFRVLRHRLREAGSPRTIAVTSPGAQEGKTLCAINLAMAFAEHGREKVLLLEANLRTPNLAATLGFQTPSCFGRQMAAHLKSPLTPWHVVAAFFHNLHVLAIDPATSSEWRMSAPGLKLAMDQLKGSGYRHIVVDCPSALGSADVNVIEDLTDGVLLTAISRKTTADNLKRAVRHLAPANIFGVVMFDR